MGSSLFLPDSTELPKRLSLDSSSSLESLASAQSVSNALPLGYQHPPFSPTGADSIASDAISVYSLSSIASSMSFISKPEGASSSSEAGGPSRGRQDYDHRMAKGSYPQRATLPRCQPSPQTRVALGGGAGSKDDEEYEGFSIISTEPLAAYPESRAAGAAGAAATKRISPDAGPRGVHVSVSSKGSVSTPNSPVKMMTLIPSPNSPFQKVGKLASSDTGESDQSSTETDSTVKSQEEGGGAGGGQLDPQELAQKILEETQSHLLAVERLQRGGGSSGNPDGSPCMPPAAAAVFRASETSAFSRPGATASTPSKPRPPARSSSLPKVGPSSGSSSPATSEASLHRGGRSPSGSLASVGSEQPLFKLKYPSSPYSAHIAKSPRHASPSSSGHHSPVGSSAPSPALSYSSSAGSARSSPADAPTLDKLKLAAIDEKVQAVHNLKMFWQSGPAPPAPARPVRGPPGTMTSRRDVLSLLNLSPRHKKEDSSGGDRLELRELSTALPSRGDVPANGHWRAQSPAQAARPLPLTAAGTSAPHPLRLPAGNGYKFLSAGRFFPSSKC